MLRPPTHLTGALVLTLAITCVAKGPRYDNPAKTDADFPFQGEFLGDVDTDEGLITVAAQVIAQGHGKFSGVAYAGGFPGNGWDGETKIPLEGERDGDTVTITTEYGTSKIHGDKIMVHDNSGNDMGTLKRTVRKSPSLGMSPPKNAVVLFDGTQSSLKHWTDGRITDDGLLMEGTTSVAKFGDHQLHMEFRLSYQPEDRGQGRSNSGLYLQGRYEVQILDSYGLEGKHNECGGIYSVGPPRYNMCFPPLTWQTYDVNFTAARYDVDGKLTADPRVTVKHNGVVIHDDIKLPGNRSTTAAPVKPGPDKGPVFLQNHSCPLRFRNVWVVEK